MREQVELRTTPSLPDKIRRRRIALAVLFWTIFCTGLLVEAYAPNLKIRNHAFVIPPSLVSQKKEIDPAAIVARERKMQLLSGILTCAGAIGLAVHYRRLLVGQRSPRP
jgi:hypothetical protein